MERGHIQREWAVRGAREPVSTRGSRTMVAHPQAGPAFRSLMNKLGAPLVAFREILCSWSWGEVGGDAYLVRCLPALPHPQRGVGTGMALLGWL